MPVWRRAAWAQAWLCAENQWSLAQGWDLGWDIPHYHNELLGIGAILKSTGWCCLVIFVGHGYFFWQLIASWPLLHAHCSIILHAKYVMWRMWRYTMEIILKCDSKQLKGVLVNSGKSCNCLTRVYMLMLSCPLRSVRFHTVLHWNGGCQPTKHHPRGILRWVQFMFGMCRPWINMPLLNWEHLCRLSMLCIRNTSMAHAAVRFRCYFSKCISLFKQKLCDFFCAAWRNSLWSESSNKPLFNYAYIV